MKLSSTLTQAALLATAAVVCAQDLAYLSHKGKGYDVDGMDTNGFSSTGFNRFGKDKYGRSYTEADAGIEGEGRRLPPHSSTTTHGPAPSHSGQWDPYWPGWGHGHDKDDHDHEKHTKRDKNGHIIDKAWYHMSHPHTVTEIQTQFEFTEVFITSSVRPTGDFWCDGGWIQLTKVGDLMDDEWAVAYITGYLQLIGANVHDVDTYDWCYNTLDMNNHAACAYQYAASNDPVDIAKAFSTASDDGTSIIILHVCELPCLELICEVTQENLMALQPLRLVEITFTKSAEARRPIDTPCLDGDGIYEPPNGDGGKTFSFCPIGEFCTAGGDPNPGNPECYCAPCPNIQYCLAPSCYAIQIAPDNATSPDWVLESSCAPINGIESCQQGYYDTPEGTCAQCPPAANCNTPVCSTGEMSMCAYGEFSCSNNYTNSAIPGGSGTCFCANSGCQQQPGLGSIFGVLRILKEDGTFLPAPNVPVSITQFNQRRDPQANVVTSDANGEYLFINVQPGTYGIYFETSIPSADGTMLYATCTANLRRVYADVVTNSGTNIYTVGGTLVGRATSIDEMPIVGLPLHLSGPNGVVDAITLDDGFYIFPPSEVGTGIFQLETVSELGDYFAISPISQELVSVSDTPLRQNFKYSPVGVISGTTTQAGSFAVIPGVTIIILHVETGDVLSLMSDAEGKFRSPELPSGNYTIDAPPTVLFANVVLPLIPPPDSVIQIELLNNAVGYNYVYGDIESQFPEC
eukprot:CFRG2554T1